VCYGRRRGGFFGSAVLRQYWGWALVLFLMGFLMTGVDNAAHAGGFVGGYGAALALGYEEERRETGVDRVLALAAVVVTALAFALALWTAFGP
jgi:rhomboid protease GluP